MEETVRAAVTTYQTADGRKITEEEYLKLQTNPAPETTAVAGKAKTKKEVSDHAVDRQ